jgi:flagellar hook-associated protein 2
MGAVGINFGAATSGTGFDVATTVASVVANLTAVETPWTTQLTSLKADDTALTSIGTDLSALSTSLTALTDFEGVMSEKEGSSSDSNVLTLTSASSTASAGDHTVVVTQLAQTASDYSDSITSTDTISGALTIQVGTGTPTTIPVVSGTSDTLATYAAAINLAGIGVTASIISDTSGSRLSLVSDTSGAGGALTITTGGTGIDSVASTATVAATSTLTLGAATNELSGTFSYAIGGGTAVAIDLGTTPLSLTATAAALNADTGFSASLVASVSGSSLVITGGTGAAGSASIDTTGSSLTTTVPSTTGTTAAAVSVDPTSSIPATNTFTFGAATDELSGTFSYAIGGGAAATVNLGTTPLSLTATAAALNADTGFSASLTATVSGSSLVITGAEDSTGAASIDTTASTLTTTTPTLTYASLADVTTPASTLNINTGLTAQDASLTVDGITGDYASNTVSTAIPGVTFQLLSKSSTPVQVEIVNDTTDVETAFSTFVAAYNTVLGDLTTQEGNTSTGTSEPLYGNSIISTLQSALSLALTTGTASGSVSNLYELGISVSNTGTLSLDNSTLDSILNSNYSDVVGFMQNSGSFGQALTTTLDYLGSTSPMGAITLALAADTTQETTFNADITAQNTLIATQQASLTTELNTANQLLQAIPQQLDEMNELYSAMTGYDTGTS